MEMMIETIQKVQLVQGDFTASEASDVVGSLVDTKINFHKLQNLCLYEGQHNDCDTSYGDGRIRELKEEKAIAKEFIKMARLEGKKVRINGTLEITILDD